VSHCSCSSHWWLAIRSFDTTRNYSSHITLFWWIDLLNCFILWHTLFHLQIWWFGRTGTAITGFHIDHFHW